MSKLAVIVLAVFIVTISFKCLAEPLEVSESQLNRKDEAESDSEPEDIDRSATAQTYASLTNRIRPGAYPPNKIKLIECYACTDCPKVLSNTTFKYCPYTGDHNKNNKCIVYSEKYKHLERPWYIRGCASERGSCAEVARAHDNANAGLVKLIHCTECEGDRCNGVHRALPTVAGAVFFVIITPLFGKYALS